MRRAQRGCYYDKKRHKEAADKHINDAYARPQDATSPTCITGRKVAWESRPRICRQHTDKCRRSIFALLVQRPISPRTSCPTNTGRLQWLTRRSSDRKRALATPQQAKRLDSSRDCRGAGLGFPNGLWREPPENWEVGCETSRVRCDSRYQP